MCNLPRNSVSKPHNDCPAEPNLRLSYTEYTKSYIDVQISIEHDNFRQLLLRGLRKFHNFIVTATVTELWE